MHAPVCFFFCFCLSERSLKCGSLLPSSHVTLPFELVLFLLHAPKLCFYVTHFEPSHPDRDIPSSKQAASSLYLCHRDESFSLPLAWALEDSCQDNSREMKAIYTLFCLALSKQGQVGAWLGEAAIWAGLGASPATLTFILKCLLSHPGAVAIVLSRGWMLATCLGSSGFEKA